MSITFFPDDDPKDRRGDYEVTKTTSLMFFDFLTTRRLLEFSTNVKLLVQTDGTYKVNWNGFSLLIVGSSDCDI